MLLRAWPLGKAGEVSDGGIALVTGGRARPTRSLPTAVISREPAVPIDSRSKGVRDRHRIVMTTTIATVMMVSPITPPRLVMNWATATF